MVTGGGVLVGPVTSRALRWQLANPLAASVNVCVGASAVKEPMANWPQSSLCAPGSAPAATLTLWPRPSPKVITREELLVRWSLKNTWSW